MWKDLKELPEDDKEVLAYVRETDRYETDYIKSAKFDRSTGWKTGPRDSYDRISNTERVMLWMEIELPLAEIL